MSWNAAPSRTCSNGVIALWHDESQLNRYAAERSDYRLLTPAYWYPGGLGYAV